MWVKKEWFKLFGLNTQGDLGSLTTYTSQARKKLVVFPRAPPLNPPSTEQIYQRQRFVAAGAQWRALTPQKRRDWEFAARRASLKCTGYNLFVFWSLTNDTKVIQTVERQSGRALL